MEVIFLLANWQNFNGMILIDIFPGCVFIMPFRGRRWSPFMYCHYFYNTNQTTTTTVNGAPNMVFGKKKLLKVLLTCIIILQTRERLQNVYMKTKFNTARATLCRKKKGEMDDMQNKRVYFSSLRRSLKLDLWREEKKETCALNSQWLSEFFSFPSNIHFFPPPFNSFFGENAA